MEVHIDKLDQRMSRVEMHLEQVTDPKIDLLFENYLPAAKKYEKESEQLESMQEDVEVMKNVIKEHSEKLKMIS